MQPPRLRICSTFVFTTVVAVLFLAHEANAQSIVRRDLEVFTDFCDCSVLAGSTCLAEEVDNNVLLPQSCLPDIDIRIIDFANDGETFRFLCTQDMNNCTWEDIPIDNSISEFRVRIDDNDEDQPLNANDELGEFEIENGETLVFDDIRDVGATLVIRLIVFLEGDELPTPETPTTDEEEEDEETPSPTNAPTPSPTAMPTPSPTMVEEDFLAVEMDGAENNPGGLPVGAYVGIAVAVLLCAACIVFLCFKRNAKSKRRKHDLPAAASVPAKKIDVSIVSGPLSPSNRSDSSMDSKEPLHKKMDSTDSSQSGATLKSVELRSSGEHNVWVPDLPVTESALKQRSSGSKCSKKVLFATKTDDHEVAVRALHERRITHECMEMIWSDSKPLDQLVSEDECRNLYGDLLRESEQRVSKMLTDFKQVDARIVEGFYEESHGAPLDKTVSSLLKLQPDSSDYSFDSFEKAAEKVLIPHIERGLATLIVQSTDTGTRLV